MFVDFDDIFNDNPQSQYKIPTQYLDFINNDLPKGIKYVADKNGNLTLSSNGQEVRIGGVKFVPNERQRRVLGNNYKLNDLLNYSYNSQQKIEISPIEDGYITLNDEKFPISKLEYNPLRPIKILDGKFYLIPQKFEQNISLKLSDGKYERIVYVSRTPNDSINILSFKSKEDEPLKINYMLDMNKSDIKMNISFNFKYAKNIKDIVESIHIYNAFIEGKGYIQGNLISINNEGKKYKEYDKNSAILWEKILMIENELNEKFDPPKKNIKYEEILGIEELYESLIMKRPFKDQEVINGINAKAKFNSDKIESLQHRSVFFEYQAKYTVTILGKKINLSALVMVFNSKILKIDKNKENTEIILEDESDTKNRYISTMYFKNKDELKRYQQQLNDEIIKMFRDAKSAHEYLNG